MISFRDFIGRAETKAFGVVALLGGLLKLPLFAAAFAALYETAGSAFTFLALAAFTVAPRVEFLPETPLTIAALLVAGIVLFKRGRTWVRSFIRRFNGET